MNGSDALYRRLDALARQHARVDAALRHAAQHAPATLYGRIVAQHAHERRAALDGSLREVEDLVARWPGLSTASVEHGMAVFAQHLDDAITWMQRLPPSPPTPAEA